MRHITEDGWLVIEDEVFNGSPKQAGSDNHAFVFERSKVRLIRCGFFANGASEAIKGSRLSDLELIECYGTRGVEDFADFVECHRVKFIRTKFPDPAPGEGPQDVTAKGGSSDFEFIDCPGLRKVVMGNYTVYDGNGYKSWLQFWPSTPKTKNFTFRGCGVPDVEGWWADGIHGECAPHIWPAIFTLIFFYVRSKMPETGVNAALVK